MLQEYVSIWAGHFFINQNNDVFGNNFFCFVLCSPFFSLVQMFLM